jgi:lysyl-tRNA synthetase class 2|tara:strand:- start:299 stop:1285 length:987 start_codon:yes stop_codon:yes gene_type:complete
MTNTSTKEVFIKRTKIIDSMRRIMNEVGYLEVETPMMHPLAGGAVARPFVTQHNALGQDLYLRIAPELYLKRLLVGGFERVFEINRSFRNEGLSTKHNPEFTMMEWYQAYASMQDQMDLTRDIILNAAKAINCESIIKWDDIEINLDNFKQATLTSLVLEHNKDLSIDNLNDPKKLEEFLKNKNIKIENSWGPGRMLLEAFEETVESNLIDPTFVTEYPVEVSPLSRRNEEKPEFADRFELFIGGKEFANGFCELNDPDDQASRFADQVAAKDSGDKEAMDYDQDYITALEHGMPPAVGVGMGVDRLVMLLTNQSSIRDVLLFPQLKS